MSLKSSDFWGLRWALQSQIATIDAILVCEAPEDWRLEARQLQVRATTLLLQEQFGETNSQRWLGLVL